MLNQKTGGELMEGEKKAPEASKEAPQPYARARMQGEKVERQEKRKGIEA